MDGVLDFIRDFPGVRVKDITTALKEWRNFGMVIDDGKGGLVLSEQAVQSAYPACSSSCSESGTSSAGRYPEA